MKHLLLTTIVAVVLAGCGESIPLWRAARDGNIEAVRQHLASGTDVDAKSSRSGSTPLHFAANYGRKEIAELLISKGAEVNAKSNKGITPLHNAALGGGNQNAAHGGQKEIAELLIAKGAEVNAKDRDGFTPLHSAAQVWIKVNTEVVELLIAEGADVNAKDDDGTTPLDWAIRRKHSEIADLLRKHGGKTGAELKASGK